MNIRDNAALKAAFDEDVTTLGGPTAVANRTRVDQARISRYCSLSDQNITTHAPIDVLGDVSRELVRRGAVPKTLQELADQLGFKLVPRAAADAEPVEHVTRQIGDIMRRVGELTVEASEAAADGKFDPDEKLSIDHKASLLEQEVAELREITRAEPSAMVIEIGAKGRAHG